MCTNFPWNKVEYDMNDIRLQVIKTTLTEDIIQLIIIDPNMRRLILLLNMHSGCNTKWTFPCDTKKRCQVYKKLPLQLDGYIKKSKGIG